MLTHWIVEIGTCSCCERVSSATLTIVVSKTTASAPTISARAILMTFGSIRSAAVASVMEASASLVRMESPRAPVAVCRDQMR
ncbi:hypothetical protein [Streptomyces sp. NBC_01264]|uniref:hypothetical protein n=1 Tax=Streptomyces sp. NBC_01264 TaxID=2903804 RepID=UPI002257D8EF|nr:hypothetical protein [Streptomyces sp. NBC_01264]MCX4781978.1 hypothetical protein [Streptomyces sp. NBC_01264]